MKKLLIVGLGNIGDKYENTRHNVGFRIVNEIAKEHSVIFETKKLGSIASFRFRGIIFRLLKPSTFMNLSGSAVKYWMDKENILLENLLIITDDININFGNIRLKTKGSAGGHNGLKDIQEKLNTKKYSRFRFGIGANYYKGKQIDFVLSEWTDEEKSQLQERLNIAVNAVISFGMSGIENTMNAYNGK